MQQQQRATPSPHVLACSPPNLTCVRPRASCHAVAGQVAYNKALKAVEVYAQLPPNSGGPPSSDGTNNGKPRKQ